MFRNHKKFFRNHSFSIGNPRGNFVKRALSEMVVSVTFLSRSFSFNEGEGDKSLGGYEIPLFTDAHITGEIIKGFGLH